MTTQKINGVYCVSNVLGGGMKNVSRTRAESQSMNGEVSVFELNKPQPYEVFSSWPDDIQKEYLKKLYWTHGGTLKKIGGLFGFSHMWAKDKFDSLGIPTMSQNEANRDGRDRAKKWDAFIRGKTLLKDMVSADTFKALAELKENLAETEETQNETPALTPAQTEEIAQKLETFKNEKPVLMPAPPETLTDINLIHISTISNAMYHIAHISDESLRSALAAELACWIWTNDAEHLKEDMKNIRRRILRAVEGGKE